MAKTFLITYKAYYKGTQQPFNELVDSSIAYIEADTPEHAKENLESEFPMLDIATVSVSESNIQRED